MESEMQGHLMFSLSREKLDVGSAEERAAFGMLKIETDDIILTEGIDRHLKSYREGPLVSGYHLAQWLAWNWWRLRWENWHSSASDDDTAHSWEFAHRMSAIGEGYVWPNIVIFSDGFRTALISEPSHESDTVPFRYLGTPPRVIPAKYLESAIDQFVSEMLARLDDEKLHETNLHVLWRDVRVERGNPVVSRFRRLEARLGYDPDEADEDAINRYLADAEELGADALEELAADATCLGAAPIDMISAARIKEIAHVRGFDACPEDAVQLAAPEPTAEWGEIAAWRVGANYARKVRRQEHLGMAESVSNERLAALAGTTIGALSDCAKRTEDMSFFFDFNGVGARVVLRSKWETGRRFDLARMIGDRLCDWNDRLFAATRSNSYRQKVQRSFAAELLSPFDAVTGRLGNDDSEERQTDIAEHYNVSPMTIRTLLVNNGRINREDAPDILNRSYADYHMDRSYW